MPDITIRPFRGVRPKTQYASKVAALPYDVMNTEEARHMVEDKHHSFLYVDKPEIDLPRGTDPYSPEVYAKAKENLHSLMDVMVQDVLPKLYIYRLTDRGGRGRAQTGLAACVSVAEYDEGLIKKHEFTRPDKEQDRINHMLACEAHTGPIFMAYRSQDARSPRLLMADLAKEQPDYDFIADDGVRHELWVVYNTDAQNSLINAFWQLPCLYIADGHHRNAAASKVAQKRNADSFDPEAEHNFYLAVIFPHDELEILDYNRVVADLNGMDIPGFLDSLKSDWLVEKSDTAVKPECKHTVGMYLCGQWYKIQLKNPVDAADIIGNLDCSVLQDKLLSPVLGIKDPKTDKRIDFVGGIRGLNELKRRVDSGEMKVAFALYPTSMDELMTVADAGQIMPPKSTWFEPKLLSGLLIHMF